MSSKLVKLMKPADFFAADYRINPRAHPFGHLLDQPDTRPCCKELRALKVSKETGDLWVALCRGCSAVHYRMRAEPGDIHLTDKVAGVPSEEEIRQRYAQPACCDLISQRVRVPSPPDRLIEQCKVCGKTHTRFLAEPGVFGVRR